MRLRLGLVQVAAAAATIAMSACSAFVSFDGLAGGEDSPAADAGGNASDGAPPGSDGSTSNDGDAPIDGGADSAKPACPAPENGLLVRFTFDEGNGTSLEDCSGNGHDGTVVGTPTWTSGQYGGALGFDGTSTCVDVGNSGVFDGPTLTVTAWVYVSDYLSTGIKGYVAGKTTNPNAIGWRIATDEPALFESRIGGGADAATGFLVTSPTGNPLNTWMHLAAVFESGTRAEVWIDGTRVGNTTTGVPPIMPDNNAKLRVGCNNGSPLKDFFEGRMDDLRIYDRRLLQSEIAALAGK